jgi:CheY-like chemotaxis protein
MGGRVRLLRTAPDKGSVFSVLLPMQKGDEGQPLIKAPENVRLEGLRSLVVDNFSVSCDIARRFLVGCGMSCDVADSLAAAREFLQAAEARAEPYHFIILDYRLDDGHALTFSRSVKDQPCFAQTQIVLVTAFGQFSSTDRLAVCGINAFLVKPFYPVQLETILKILRNAQQKGEALPVLTRHSLTGLLQVGPEKNPDGKKMHFPGVRILVVEDMPVNRMLMTKVLENLGCALATAVNGREALKRVSEDTYDLVFMDCQMPEMDGYEATKEIRMMEVGKGKHLPIVALTADAMTGDRERCLAAGMDDYLYKPFKQEQIVAMIEKWAFKRRG